MSTRAKYNRVFAKREENQVKADTDILLKRSERYGKYIGRALTLLFDEKKTFVTIKAAEKIIERAIWVAEVLKRKVSGLHQIVRFSENRIVDVYEPKEEGLLRVETQRFLTVIEIVLTKDPTSEQKNEPGYQAPVKTDPKEVLTLEKWEASKVEREERKKRYEEGGQRENRKEDRKPRQDNRERKPRQNDYERKPREDDYQRKPRREHNNQERGGQRKRGRNY